MEMIKDIVEENECHDSILKKSNSVSRKNVSIVDEPLYIYDNFDNVNDAIENINEQEHRFFNKSTSPINSFSMDEFLNGLDQAIDIGKINEAEIKDEIEGKYRHVNLNTFYAVDIFSLFKDSESTIINSQDKRKTREERKREREKKKEEEMLKKYQIEQEAKHRAIARSKCGRWVKFNIKIGEGGYKFVYKGYDVEEARNIAWCEFKKEHVDTKEKRQTMFRETEIMLKMNHSHIVRCFGVLKEWDAIEESQTLDARGIVIIQELMGEGTLKNMIKKNFVNGECILRHDLLLSWCHQVLDALKYMHQKCDPPIIHRDLKADNCFLYGQADDECLNVKVGDFGLATHLKTSGRKTLLGTMGFMAPEIFDEKYDVSVDMYAFGMLMLEVITNRTPFDDCETLVQVATKTLCGDSPKVLEMVQDKCLQEIITMCIHPMASFRPTAEELYLHPVFHMSKGLLVEVELNYDKISKRIEEFEPFFLNFPTNTKINLRLKFREKKMQLELGLDDTESLEFDLDIYKGEDQDIPELIQNLRVEYEDKLSRYYDNPKITDRRTIDANLDKLFLNIKLQLQYLVKYILSKRWHDILDILIADISKTNETDPDYEELQNEVSNMGLSSIGHKKKLWAKAKKLLDKEIQQYRENSQFNIMQDIKQNNSETFGNVEINSQSKNLNPNHQESTTEFLKPLDIESYTSGVIDANIMKNPPNTPSAFSLDKNLTISNSDSQKNEIDNNFNNTVQRKTEVAHTKVESKIFYSICVQKITTIGEFYVVKFSVEIPADTVGGKYVGVYKTITKVNDINLEVPDVINFIGVQNEDINKDVLYALRETIGIILRQISCEKDSFALQQSYVFFPISENKFLSEIGSERVNSKMNRPKTSDSNFQKDIDNQIKYQSNEKSKENIYRTFKQDIDNLFENEDTILLTKRVEGNNKEVIRAYQIPLGSAISLFANGMIHNVKKPTMICPKMFPTGDIIFKEFNTDLTLETAINFLSSLQSVMADFSNKGLIQPQEFPSKVLYEVKKNDTDISEENSSDFKMHKPQRYNYMRHPTKIQENMDQFNPSYLTEEMNNASKSITNMQQYSYDTSGIMFPSATRVACNSTYNLMTNTAKSNEKVIPQKEVALSDINVRQCFYRDQPLKYIETFPTSNYGLPEDIRRNISQEGNEFKSSESYIPPGYNTSYSYCRVNVLDPNVSKDKNYIYTVPPQNLINYCEPQTYLQRNNYSYFPTEDYESKRDFNQERTDIIYQTENYLDMQVGVDRCNVAEDTSIQNCRDSNCCATQDTCTFNKE